MHIFIFGLSKQLFYKPLCRSVFFVINNLFATPLKLYGGYECGCAHSLNFIYSKTAATLFTCARKIFNFASHTHAYARMSYDYGVIIYASPRIKFWLRNSFYAHCAININFTSAAKRAPSDRATPFLYIQKHQAGREARTPLARTMPQSISYFTQWI